MGQKAKNAGKKASKVCYKEADAKSCKVTFGSAIKGAPALLGKGYSYSSLSEIALSIEFSDSRK